MPVDLFPSTHRTWIESRLTDGPAGAAEVRAHVMARSVAPLVAYVRAARVPLVGDAEEVVHDFFAKRLGEGDYLERWLASGLPLRRWLMNGVSAHLRALWREKTRENARSSSVDEARDLAGDDRAAERAFERAWVRVTLGAACARVSESLAAEGDGLAWSVFERHVLQGMSYRAIVVADGGAPTSDEEERLAVVVRRVVRRVRAELRAILREDGVREGELDAEVARLSEGLDG
ncbi:MAG: hypothetical protein ACO3IB_07335 [Phycisphaerales bacterium]